ncbi:MAG: hypothetical protein ACOH13_12595 [Flavobacteriales bacterium]
MRNRFLPFLCLPLLLAAGCKKPLADVNDYFPVVTTESVVENPDGSVLVTGRIVNTGEDEVQFAGICASSSSLPTMTENQALCQLDGDRFSTTYSGLDAFGTYYFRAFASNSFGYSYGEVLQVDSVTAVPFTPPCTLAPNSVDLGTFYPSDTYGYIQAIQSSGFNYTFQANGGYSNSTITFGAVLHTGLYTTTSSTDPGADQFRISFTSNLISSSLSAGTPVYVQQLTPTSWEVTICSAPWLNGGVTSNYSTRFVCHT